MGVPVYPGAVRGRSTPTLASLHLDFGDVHKGFALSAARIPHLRLRGSSVTEFYRDELPHWMFSQKENGCMQLSLTKHGYKRIVAIYEDEGETRIALASVGEPASN